MFSVWPIICVCKNKVNESPCPDQDSTYPWYLKEKGVCGVGRWGGELRGSKVNACSRETGVCSVPAGPALTADEPEVSGRKRKEAHEDFCVCPLLGIYWAVIYWCLSSSFQPSQLLPPQMFLLRTSLLLPPFHVTHFSDVGLPSPLQLLCFLLTSFLCAASLEPKSSPVLVAGVFFLGSTCGLH